MDKLLEGTHEIRVLVYNPDGEVHDSLTQEQIDVLAGDGFIYQRPPDGQWRLFNHIDWEAYADTLRDPDHQDRRY